MSSDSYSKKKLKNDISINEEEKAVQKISFVHDIKVSCQNIYPIDLKPDSIIIETMKKLKIISEVEYLKEVLSESECSKELFTNLFWLYFSLRFQRKSYNELKKEYKRNINKNYKSLFLLLHKIDENEKEFEKQIVSARIKKIPVIYA